MATSVQSDIHQLLDRYAEAYRSIDFDTLESIYADDVIVIDTMNAEKQRGREPWLDVLRSVTDEMTDAVCTISDVEIQPLGDLALVTASIFYGDTSEGEVVGMTTRSTMLLQPVDGSWKIIHEHNSVPLNQDMQPIL